MANTDNNLYAASIPMVKFQASHIDGSCNGSLYFAEDYTGRIVVSNPLRSQFRILPPMHLKMYKCWNSTWTAIGLGFDSVTKAFKMVCSNQRPSSSYFKLVHTLGTTSWREVSSVPAFYRSKVIDYKSVFVHGFLHWMMDPLVIDSFEGQILAFDITILGEIDVDVTVVIDHWKEDGILFSFHNRNYSPSSVKYWSYSMRTGNITECEYRNFGAEVYSPRGSLISLPGATEVS